MEERIGWFVVLLALMCEACGNEGDNDQGVSFRLIGIFRRDRTSLSRGKHSGGHGRWKRQEDQCQVPTTENAISDQNIALPLNSSSIDKGYVDSASFLSCCRGFPRLQNDLFVCGASG